MLCQCWSYFFHWTNIDKMSNILVLYQCHFKICCYNVTLTSYQWLYQHWTLKILLRCCKSTHIKRGQVCDEHIFQEKMFFVIHQMEYHHLIHLSNHLDGQYLILRMFMLPIWYPPIVPRFALEELYKLSIRSCNTQIILKTLTLMFTW